VAGESVDFRSIFNDPDSIALDVVNNWSQWSEGRNVWLRGVQEVDRYINATSTETTDNDKNGFCNTTHRPKLTSIYDRLVSQYLSGLLSSKDWLSYEGNDEASVAQDVRALITGYIKTKHRLYGHNKVVRSLVDDWVRKGNAFSQVTYVNEFTTHPQTGQKIPGYVGPKTLRIDTHDIAFNPLAKDFESSPKIVRSLKTLGECARELEENPGSLYKQEVFDMMVKDRQTMAQGGLAADDVDKYIQMQYDGFGSYTQYINSGQVEFLDFYGDYYDINSDTFYKNQVITVVDRRYVIRSEALNTWNGRPHIFHAGWRLRTNNLWAMGPLENIVGLQYRIDHLENAQADAFDTMLSPDLVFIGDVDVRQGENGAKEYWITDGNGSVTQLSPDTTVLNANLQIPSIEQSMDDYAGVPPESAGFRTPGEKTKFEVAELSTAGLKVFQNKLQIFEEEMLEKTVNAELELGRTYFNTTDTIELLDPVTGAKLFTEITKEDITANGKLVPVGASHFIRASKLARELLQFQQSALTDPSVAMHFPAKQIAKMWEQVLGFGSFELFSEYGRIAEELEAERLRNAARNQLEEEDSTSTDEPDDEDNDQELVEEELI